MLRIRDLPPKTHRSQSSTHRMTKRALHKRSSMQSGKNGVGRPSILVNVTPPSHAESSSCTSLAVTVGLERRFNTRSRICADDCLWLQRCSHYDTLRNRNRHTEDERRGGRV